MQNLSCENDFYYHANKTRFHKKGFVNGVVLRVRVFGTRKWSIKYIEDLYDCTFTFFFCIEGR